MSTTRSHDQIERLATYNQYAIDLVIKGNYSHVIMVSADPIKAAPKRDYIMGLSLNPFDQLTLGALTEGGMNRLGKDREPVLKLLSNILRTRLGGQQFILLPKNCSMPGYTIPDKRFHTVDRKTLCVNATSILDDYPELVNELDTYSACVDFTTLMAGQDVQVRAQEIDALLKEKSATDEARVSIDEEVTSILSRLKSCLAEFIAVLDRENRLIGLVRGTRMSASSAFFITDIFMSPVVVSLNDMKGESLEEQTYQRERFLLAYMTTAMCGRFQQYSHYVINLTKGSRQPYEDIGFLPNLTAFSDCKIVKHIKSARPLLKQAQTTLQSLPPETPAHVLTASQSPAPSYGRSLAIGFSLATMGLFAYKLYQSAQGNESSDVPTVSLNL